MAFNTETLLCSFLKIQWLLPNNIPTRFWKKFSSLTYKCPQIFRIHGRPIKSIFVDKPFRYRTYQPPRSKNTNPRVFIKSTAFWASLENAPFHSMKRPMPVVPFSTGLSMKTRFARREQMSTNQFILLLILLILTITTTMMNWRSEAWSRLFSK